MSRTLIARFSASALLLTGCWIAYTQNQGKQPPALTLNKVKDDLYEIEGDGGNVAVYVTNEGVILVDDKFEQDYENIMAKVKSVTDQPVRYVLSTHHHSDHSGGNVKFISTAEIISTANARANIVEHKQPNAPLIDYIGGGSLKAWTQTLDGALQLDFDTVIPGHGPVTNKAGLLSYRNNVEKLRDRAAGLIHEGKSQEEVGKVMMAEFGWGPNSMQAQWSLPGMMTELK
jgi:glyoxylase-like metal-dependent hydrolase (beta-lactamase superfamily II)